MIVLQRVWICYLSWHSTTPTPTPTSLRGSSPTRPTRAISWSYSCGKLNVCDTPTFSRRSSRECRQGCRCRYLRRRRGMPALPTMRGYEVISGICHYVCVLCVSPRFNRNKRLALSTYRARQLLSSACIVIEVSRSKVKVKRLSSALRAWICTSLWLLRLLYGCCYLLCWPQPPRQPAKLKRSYTIPNKHGCRQDCGCWLQQNDVKLTSLYRRPACDHVRWGRSASQSTASNASAVLTGRKKSREYLI